MSHFLSNRNDEISQGNRYYCKITKLLPAGVNFAHKKFELHNKLFHCCPFWGAEELNVCIIVSRFSRDENGLVPIFNVRIGIVGEDLTELAALKAEPLTDCVSDVFTVAGLIHRSQLNSPTLYLFIEIRREDDNIQLVEKKKTKASKEKIETDYRDLLLSGKNSDVTLKVKNKKFYCHRCILAARSPVFAAMMQNDMADKVSGDIIIEDADPNVFEMLLLFLYTGKEDYLSWQNVTDLYKLADKYGVEDMKSVCRNHIKETNRVDAFCKFIKLSLLHNDSELNKLCDDVIKENVCKGNFCALFKFSLSLNVPVITKTIVQFFLKHSKDIGRQENWTRFLSEESNKWLSVDHIKEIISTENFFFFFKLSKLQNDSEVTKTTVQFFLKHARDIIRSENWLTFQVKNAIECHELIRVLASK